MSLKEISSARVFGGEQKIFEHESAATRTKMRFGLFLPPQVKRGPRPLLWFLSGLTCTEENVILKSGFQRVAAELGVAVVCPDTSPRGEDVADDDAWDLGQGAGSGRGG